MVVVQVTAREIAHVRVPPERPASEVLSRLAVYSDWHRYPNSPVSFVSSRHDQYLVFHLDSPSMTTSAGPPLRDAFSATGWGFDLVRIIQPGCYNGWNFLGISDRC